MKHHFVRRWISAALSGVLTVLLLAVPFSGAVPKASENWKSLLSAEPITAQAAGGSGGQCPTHNLCGLYTLIRGITPIRQKSSI